MVRCIVINGAAIVINGAVYCDKWCGMVILMLLFSQFNDILKRVIAVNNKISILRNKSVVKANELIQKSRFNLSLQQQKIILYLISQIKYDDEEFKLYEFSIIDFCKVCGIDADSGKNYADLKASIQEIANKSIWVKLENGKETLLRWIDKPYIDSGSGTIQIKLDNDMKPYLLQLKEKFTRYELIYTLHFKRKYSIRLYELIKSLHFNERDTYSRIFEVEELKKLIGAENYTQTRDFKSAALLPAIEEINLYSDKTVSIEELHQGRKITHFKLFIETKPAIDRFRIRAEIEKEMEMDLNQLTLWDDV